MFRYSKKILKVTGSSVGLVILILTSIFLYQASASASEEKAYDIRSVEAEQVVEDLKVQPEETTKVETETVVTQDETQETETIQQVKTQVQTQTQTQNQTQTQTTTASQDQGQANAVVVNSTPQVGVPLTDDLGRTIAIQNASVYSAQVNEVLNITNEYRAQNGLAPLQLDTSLTYAAMHRAAEMAHLDDGSSQVSHTRPNGQKFSSIIYVYGISCSAIGENILDVYNTSQSAMNGWINSTTHRDNILGNYTKIGVGVAVASNGVYYWAQLFTR